MLVNCTPHTLNIHEGNEVTTIEPSGTVARVSTTTTPVVPVDGISVNRRTLGTVTGIPDSSPGVFYVCSGMVEGATDREDVFSPGELVRNDKGQPIGCKGLSQT